MTSYIARQDEWDQVYDKFSRRSATKLAEQKRPVPNVNHYMQQEYRGYGVHDGLPEGFSIERRHQTFTCYYKTVEHRADLGTTRPITSTTTHAFLVPFGEGGRFQKHADFSSFEDAYNFIMDFVDFLKWMSGIAASTPAEEVQQIEDPLAEQYREYEGCIIYYTEVADQSERVALLKKVGRDGVNLVDPAEPHDLGCWYSFDEICNVRIGRQHGWV